MFKPKTWACLRYFLSIKVTQSNSRIVVSQRKYTLDILEDAGMLDCRLINTLMVSNIKLLPEWGKPLIDPKRYRRLVGKLNYFTIT